MPCSPVPASFLYPCDLTDVEWAHLAPLLPEPARRGRPRRWALRLLLNAIFYVLRTGCAWRYLPREYPPWATVYTTFRGGVSKGSGSACTRPCVARSAGGLDVIPHPRRRSWTAREARNGICWWIRPDCCCQSISSPPTTTSDREGPRRLLIGL